METKHQSFLKNLSTYLSFLALALILSSCASPDRKIFVYGFGKVSVPKNATIDEINVLVRDMYGTELFWSPK